MHKLIVWIQQVAIPALGPFGLFLAAFLDASFLSLPEISDLLVVAYAAAHPEQAFVPVAMTTLGSVAGCSALWWLGRQGGALRLVKRFGVERVEKTRRLFVRYGVFAVGIPAMLPPPTPFKIFVLCAGVFGLGYGRMVAAVAVGRGLRYTVWALLGIAYGDEAMALLRRLDAGFAEHARVWLLALAALAAAGGVWCWRRRAARAGEERRRPAPISPADDGSALLSSNREVPR